MIKITPANPRLDSGSSFEDFDDDDDDDDDEGDDENRLRVPQDYDDDDDEDDDEDFDDGEPEDFMTSKAISS